jgi:CheY-like chemotaxis protein
MPKMDGWEVLAVLRRLRPETYVVVASGYDLAQLRQERRAVVPDGWLQKPFLADELAALLPTQPSKPA